MIEINSHLPLSYHQAFKLDNAEYLFIPARSLLKEKGTGTLISNGEPDPYNDKYRTDHNQPCQREHKVEETLEVVSVHIV